MIAPKMITPPLPAVLMSDSSYYHGLILSCHSRYGLSWHVTRDTRVPGIMTDKSLSLVTNNNNTPGGKGEDTDHWCNDDVCVCQARSRRGAPRCWVTGSGSCWGWTRTRSPRTRLPAPAVASSRVWAPPTSRPRPRPPRRCRPRSRGHSTSATSTSRRGCEAPGPCTTPRPTPAASDRSMTRVTVTSIITASTIAETRTKERTPVCPRVLVTTAPLPWRTQSGGVTWRGSPVAWRMLSDTWTRTPGPSLQNWQTPIIQIPQEIEMNLICWITPGMAALDTQL